MLLLATLLLVLLQRAMATEDDQSAVRSETLLRNTSSWDDEPYKSYSSGQPELSVLKITLQPNTELEWHSHPIPSAAYVVAGELTVERKKDGKKQILSPARRFPGNEPVVLVVFYAGRPGIPVTQKPKDA